MSDEYIERLESDWQAHYEDLMNRYGALILQNEELCRHRAELQLENAKLLCANDELRSEVEELKAEKENGEWDNGVDMEAMGNLSDEIHELQRENETLQGNLENLASFAPAFEDCETLAQYRSVASEFIGQADRHRVDAWLPPSHSV